MKKVFLILFTIWLFAITLFAQSGTSIKQKCQSPFSSIYGQVNIVAVGNINVNPCPNHTTFFTQTVDFSGATVIGLPFTTSPLTTKGDLWGFSSVNAHIPIGTNGQVLTADSTQVLGLKWATPTTGTITGSGTINTLPKFTGASAIGDSHITDNGTTVAVTSNFFTLSGIGTNGGAVVAAGGIIGGTTQNNGQLLIGNTGNTPTAATITAGTGISVTNGAGTITIADTNPTIVSTFLASNYTNATTGFTNTALSLTLTAGKTYSFACQLFASDSTAADGIQVDFNGGAATATTFIAGSNSVLVTGTSTTLTGTFSNATITGTNLISINGTIVVNAGGTFIVRGAQVAHTVGTLSILTGSRCTASLLN